MQPLGVEAEAHLTFPADDGEVRVGGADGEDKLVSDEGLVCVDGTDGLDQLRRAGRENRFSLDLLGPAFRLI